MKGGRVEVEKWGLQEMWGEQSERRWELEQRGSRHKIRETEGREITRERRSG